MYSSKETTMKTLRILPVVFLALLVIACEAPTSPSSTGDDDRNQTQVINIIIDDHSGNGGNGDGGDDDGNGNGNGDTNQPPTIVSPGDQANFVGDNVLLQIVASDPDNDKLAWTITGIPRGLVISQTGLISGPVSSSSAVDSPWTAATVLVADGNGGTSGVVFTWTVTAVQ